MRFSKIANLITSVVVGVLVEPVCRTKARKRSDTAFLRLMSGHTKLNLIRLLSSLVFATSTCHVLLCSDIIHLPIKSGIPCCLLSVACTMGDSKVDDFLLEGRPEAARSACGARLDSEQQVLSSQMLQEACQLPVSGIRTKSDFVLLSQFSPIPHFPMLPTILRHQLAPCFRVALIVVEIRCNRWRQISRSFSDEFVTSSLTRILLSVCLYTLTFEGRRDSA